ncbi:hypothetical protein F5Y16DRAFT_397009 [Xylariaceae sp. FL0255]|nr:hypothetical protein F5Y16DRAFT_397009 [Xylariaceae sp. FL0255]
MTWGLHKLLFAVCALWLRSIAGADSPPSYCVPFDTAEDDDHYYWYDVSDFCASMDLGCANACVSFDPVEDCTTVANQAIIDDLQSGMENQITKDGLFEKTNGKYYTVCFGKTTTAFHERDVSEAFVAAIAAHYNSTSSPNADQFVFFQVFGDGWSDYMEAEGTRALCP